MDHRRPREMLARLSVALVAAVAVVPGCTSSDASPGRGAVVTVDDDVEAIRRVLADDPAEGAIREAERVSRDRPVMAARMMREGAIPAATRQQRALEELDVETVAGRRLLRQAVDANRARVEALQGLAETLARGVDEDLELVEALSAHRHAAEAIVAVHDALDAASPMATPTPSKRGSGPRARPGSP